MKSARFFPVAIVLTVLLALSAGLGTAQGPAPQGGAPHVQVGSTFTYQGELRQSGNPINATCTMTFTLYDDAITGTVVGAPIPATVDVTDGLFTQALDFGSGVFTGDARWLEVAVLCPGDLEASTLAPRQALTAAPYALSLQPGASIVGNMSSGTPVLYVANTSDQGFAIAVQGHATATSGITYGVVGMAGSSVGSGVYGIASASSGTTYGVYGLSDSAAGRGVYGWATASTGTVYGVSGRANSTEGSGVYGHGSAASGNANGVYGLVDSVDGAGVRGLAQAASGNTFGVRGESVSYSGRGVAGFASAPMGAAYGVFGQTNSSEGCGVYGWAADTSGYTSGVFGTSSSPLGSGVVGSSVSNNGVYGASTSGAGIVGYVDGSGWAGYFSAPNGNGVHIDSNAGLVGLEVAGGTKSAVVPTDEGARLLYTEESAEVWFTDYGFGQLTDGSATVVIDPLYAQTVNLDVPYLVFLTPQGDCGLYVTAKTATSFTVRALDGKTCGIAFDYRIVAKRLGFEGKRLEPSPGAGDVPHLFPVERLAAPAQAEP